ncbi:MAG: M6 family metalloprotease domain-containing protein [Bacteroidales bacterium]|nr:M6 family metalloprotease domain-containing protein [Bacteroidales bacterium]
MISEKINGMVKGGVLLSAALLSSLPALAIPAHGGLSVINQSDGTSVTFSLLGDEFRAMYVSADGYLLLPGSHGDLFYACRAADGSIVPSDVLATDTPDAATASFKASIDKESIKDSFASESARESAARRARAVASRAPDNKINDYPTIGEQKVLVILARFADIDFYTPDIHTAIDRSLNEPGYNHNGSTGSVRDYFIDNSNGLYKPEMVVYGPVTLPQNMEYYGAPNGLAQDSRPGEMIRDACRLLDDEIDFSQFDLDHDGEIDNVYLFFAGYSQADGANPNTIWPHAAHAWGQTLATFDGVRLNHYACSNEVEFGTNKLVNIGTFCHEFSHVLGLPDLYATDYSNKAHPGEWSLMAEGGRLNDSRTPPCMSAYERYSLGWLEPTELVPSAKSFELPDISENEALILRSPTNPKEIFMFEYRAKKGWDSYIPGHGMLVWHVDFDADLWTSNIVNNDASHQYIDLLEANNSYYSREGNAFPGTSDVRSITDATTPSLRDWSGKDSGIGIYNITETADGKVKFNVIDASAKLATPKVASATEISPVSFVANWEAVEGADSYVIDVFTSTRVGSSIVRTYLPDYRVKVVEGATLLEVTGLEPATTYYYSVRAMGGSHISEYSNDAMVTTGDKDFRFFAPETDAPADVFGTSFTANWKALEGATSYFVTVYEVSEGETETYTNDFSGETVTPYGWTASAACAISNFYGGAARPALTMAGDLYIQSPGDERDMVSAKFWCRGLTSSWDDVNEVVVSGYRGLGEWIELDRIWPVSTDSKGETITLSADEFPAPVHALRIEFKRPYGSGTLVVDDIEVVHGATSKAVVEGYQAKSVGNVLSAEITGLKPETLYHYVVSATDGTLQSSDSWARPVRTTKFSGVEGVSAGGNVAVSVSGLGVTASNGTSADAVVEVYDIAGMKVAAATVAAGSSATVSVPARGIYLIKTPEKVIKVVI